MHLFIHLIFPHRRQASSGLAQFKEGGCWGHRDGETLKKWQAVSSVPAGVWYMDSHCNVLKERKSGEWQAAWRQQEEALNRSVIRDPKNQIGPSYVPSSLKKRKK